MPDVKFNDLRQAGNEAGRFVVEAVAGMTLDAKACGMSGGP